MSEPNTPETHTGEIKISITNETVTYEAHVDDNVMPVPEVIFWMRLLENMILTSLGDKNE